MEIDFVNLGCRVKIDFVYLSEFIVMRHWVGEGLVDFCFHVWAGRSVLLVNEVM